MNPQVLAGMAERANAKNWLETYAHKASQNCAKYFASLECVHLGFQLFIDSGAFTAWKDGKAIDHDGYIRYAKDLREVAYCPVVFASLDVIAGSLEGDNPTPNEFRAAATKGWQNYLKEKAAGLKTIPTFHQGDPWDFLDLMANDTDYIGLSPRKVNTTTPEKAEWLNEVFHRIDLMGKLPKPGNMQNALKTHGLGVASPVLMEYYPWYSVDSTRWLQGGNGYYFYFDGSRIQLIHSSKWKRHVENKSGETISAIRHYKPPLQANLVYYYHEQAIRADAECNAYMTEHWLERGVDWNIAENS